MVGGQDDWSGKAYGKTENITKEKKKPAEVEGEWVLGIVCLLGAEFAVDML